jgi:hypothetical protein
VALLAHFSSFVSSRYNYSQSSLFSFFCGVVRNTQRCAVGMGSTGMEAEWQME